MTIYVNNTACELPGNAVVADALAAMNIPAQRGVALAVNSTVVPAKDWQAHPLQDNDKIIIIKATQGG